MRKACVWNGEKAKPLQTAPICATVRGELAKKMEKETAGGGHLHARPEYEPSRSAIKSLSRTASSGSDQRQPAQPVADRFAAVEKHSGGGTLLGAARI